MAHYVQSVIPTHAFIGL